MSFLDFLKELPFFRPLSFERYPDSFASTRTVLYARLMKVVESQVEHRSTVLMAAHFPAEFFRLQEELNGQGISYQLITRPLDPQWFADHRSGREGGVFLALAEFLTSTNLIVLENETFDSRLDLIVVDRHPRPVCDHEVEAFARAFPATTRVGYFLALEDRVLQSVVNDTTKQVLKQMGIDDQGLISSGIISKRITKVLAREEKRRQISNETATDLAADSVENWFELNGD